VRAWCESARLFFACGRSCLCVVVPLWDVMQNALGCVPGGLVKGGSTWEFDSVCTYVRTMMSVFGPSMSENSDTKVSRQTKNHVT
jgi:hypothetical protein